MTHETRYVADLPDIAGFRLECQTCHTKVLWPVHPPRQLMKMCPSCNTGLLVDGSVARAGLIQMLQGLGMLVEDISQPRSVSIRLEIKPAGVSS
jgi:hypothetical protein